MLILGVVLLAASVTLTRVRSKANGAVFGDLPVINAPAANSNGLQAPKDHPAASSDLADQQATSLATAKDQVLFRVLATVWRE